MIHRLIMGVSGIPYERHSTIQKDQTKEFEYEQE
jgi:hypothetical protein